MSEWKHITLEGNNLSEFGYSSTDSGDLSTSADAALVGSYGMSFLLDDNNEIYAGITPSFNSTMRFRIMFDLNSLTMANNNEFVCVKIFQSGGGYGSAFRLWVKYTSGGGYTIRADGRNDAGTSVLNDTEALPDEPICVEWLMVRATGSSSNDGYYEWWINGVSKGSASGVDNYNRMGDYTLACWFCASEVDTGTRGTFYMDDIIIRDDDTQIGCPSSGESSSPSASQSPSSSPSASQSPSSSPSASQSPSSSPSASASASASSSASPSEESGHNQYTITQNSDDCSSGSSAYNESGQYGNILYIDDGEGADNWYSSSWRFHHLEFVGTVTSAILTLQRPNDNNGANGTVRFRCQESNNPATFSSEDRPYNRTYRAEYIDHVFPSDGVTQEVDVTDLLNDLLGNGYTYDGDAEDAIVFTAKAGAWGLSPVSWRALSYDYNYGSEYAAKLDITYTTTASESASQSPSSSPSASASASASASVSPSSSPSASASASASASQSPSSSPSASQSPSSSPSSSASSSPSASQSPSSSPSASQSPSSSESVSVSASASASASASISPSASASPSIVYGSVCWGHITGVTEDNVRTFAQGWIGTGEIGGSGDAEQICLDTDEYMLSEIIFTDVRNICVEMNHYSGNPVDGNIYCTVHTGATEESCADWDDEIEEHYHGCGDPFESLGYIQIVVEHVILS